jgi:hypothetical protein
MNFFLRIIEWISFLKALIWHFMKGTRPDKMCQLDINSILTFCDRTSC